jgi:hypothetical protein
VRIDGKITWDKQYEHLYVQLGPIFEAQGLEWYGRGKNAFELVHYQLPTEMSVYDAQSIFAADGLIGVWLKLNQRWGEKDV